MFLKRLFVVAILAVGLNCWNSFYNLENKETATALSSCALRFHVRANSDSKEDQELKLKVRDEICKEMYRRNSGIKNVDDAISFVKANDNHFKRIAQRVVSKYGFEYKVSSRIGCENFPKKYYGNLCFPKGNYTSYVINIGKGKGHNWWCVLYPSLCFVDSTTATVPEESREVLNDSLSSHQQEMTVIYRFKYLTFLNDWFDL